MRLALVLAVLTALTAAAATSAHDLRRPHRDRVRHDANAYELRVLVVNKEELAQPGTTQIVDPFLLNPWGTAIRPSGAGGHSWLANAGSQTVTEYVGDVFDASGQFLPLFQDSLKVVFVDGSPIGQVFSGSATDFPVTGAVCPDSDDEACPPGGSTSATAPRWDGRTSSTSRQARMARPTASSGA